MKLDAPRRSRPAVPVAFTGCRGRAGNVSTSPSIDGISLHRPVALGRPAAADLLHAAGAEQARHLVAPLRRLHQIDLTRLAQVAVLEGERFGHRFALAAEDQMIQLDGAGGATEPQIVALELLGHLAP